MRLMTLATAWLLLGCGAITTSSASPETPIAGAFRSDTATSTNSTLSVPPVGPRATVARTPVPTMPLAADLQAQLIDPGRLTACISVVGAPAAGLDGQGRLVGYNVAFAEAIADRLDLTLRTREPLFDTLLDLVADHECDAAVSSLNISTSRLALVDFVPYTKSVQPVLVARGNPLAVDELLDLCGQPVSATEGTTHIDLVNGTGDYVGQGLNEQCSSSGRAPIELQTFETESHSATALLSGDVVAYLGNPNFAFEFPDRVEYSPAALPPARQGIATANDRPALHAAVAATLNAMINDGTYRAILDEHLPNEESVRVVSILE